MHFANKKVSFMFVAPNSSKVAWTEGAQHRSIVLGYAVPDFQQVQLLSLTI
jgi:hypothetical protein